jgi:hypothetical protein
MPIGIPRANRKDSRIGFRNYHKAVRPMSAGKDSKSYDHPDVARLKTQPLVKALRIDASVVREQFDQPAAPRARFSNGPLQHLLADAPAPAMSGNANVLDQRARGTLRTQARQDAKLQTADDDAALLCDHQLDIGIVLDGFEGAEIRGWQRLFNPLASAAERIVSQHRNNSPDVVATGTPNSNSGNFSHDIPAF